MRHKSCRARAGAAAGGSDIPDFSDLPLFQNLALFAAAATVIGFGGVALVNRADLLAARTGLGQTIIGAALLGAGTSLSGTVTSVTAAADGNAALSVSTAIGGIAVQTAFLTVADMFHRRVNLEHEAASIAGLTQSGTLILMLSLPLITWASPEISWLGIHPVTIILPAVYAASLRLTNTVRLAPMWLPKAAAATASKNRPNSSTAGPRTATAALEVFALILLIGTAGWLIAQTGGAIAAQAQMSQTLIGVMMTAVVTSLPELVTTIAAVRRGALELAVAGIIGGNTYDVLFLALSDAAYRPGSIYHAMEPPQLFWLSVSILMASILLIGLVRRERRGIANIGFEGVLILLVYLFAVAVQFGRG